LVGENLFKAAAFLNLVAIPGHMKYGFDHVYPAFRSIATPKHELGGRGGLISWDYINAVFLISALLNWRWSVNAGPRGNCDKAIFWTQFIAGGIAGFRYWQARFLPPILTLWIAPICALGGWVLVD
ncbi:uncharacterized protein N7446_011737, partial [Penicillium canescens]|uniref:uncharacterized protein n=1 Tax=Penicillium canescens TaxID=5083 RepID=UPI0026DF20C2